MKTAFDTNRILYRLLTGKTSIKGGVYVGDDRPDESTNEDIVVNTIDITMDSLPQIGTSNVNVYVPDINVKIGGKTQLTANRKRLDALTNEVVAIIKGANVTGIKAIVGKMYVMNDTTVKQHFVNIRIDWNIQN